MAAHDCTDGFSPVYLGEYTARAARYAVSRAPPSRWGDRGPSAYGHKEEAAEAHWQCRLFRDLVRRGRSPFSLVSVWLSPTVSSLAQAAYEQRALPSGELDLQRLAVLADALEEAGCAEAELLGHLRAAGPHVRGCWALDLALGKE